MASGGVISENGTKWSRNPQLGDLVLARVKGYAAWPAKVSSLEEIDQVGTPCKITVQLFGTKDIGLVAMSDLQPFTEAVKDEMVAQLGASLCTGTCNRSLTEAMSEICKAHDEMLVKTQFTEDYAKDKILTKEEVFLKQVRGPSENPVKDYGNPYLFASNLPMGLTAKKVKRYFKADAHVYFNEEYGSADIHCKNIESTIKSLRFNGSIWRKHLIRLDWYGNYPSRIILITGFDTTPKVKKIRRLLGSHFSPCGNIRRLSILTYRHSLLPGKKAGNATGKAFMEFGTDESLIKGILLDQSVVNGFRLKVQVAKPKPVRHNTKPSLWQGKRIVFETTLDDLWEGKRIVYDSDE